jgi:6-phosphogluconate dehydrogenase
MEKSMKGSDIGVIGLGVMGRNLALNLADHGCRVAVFNRRAPGEEHLVREFVDSAGDRDRIAGAETLEAFIGSLARPRKILLMITAGKPVDYVLADLVPLLESGDIVIDGGNSHYEDTTRRTDDLAKQGILFVGMGVSGGEEGARYGPSLMPGGNDQAWETLRPILEPIAALAFDGSPCCAWMGGGGAGHFVKMVHNGIEYADMQLIAEVYDVITRGLGMSAAEAGELFALWSQTELSSYLVEITRDILATRDEDGEPLVEKIVDSAGQKGTGRWTGMAAMEMGVPLPAIGQAVFARYISAQRDLRLRASKTLSGPRTPIDTDRETVISELADGLLGGRMATYAEGFHFITTAGRKHGWQINPAAVAHIWQGGCIIRSRLLIDIEDAYRGEPGLEHLFLSDAYASALGRLQDGWRGAIGLAVDHGLPVPNMMAGLGLYDSLRAARLPANLIQAQRDYFGAHTYERVDRPEETGFHTEWGAAEG